MAEHLLQSEGTAERLWRRLRHRLVPAFADQKDKEFFGDIALLGAVMFAGAIGAYLVTVDWSWPFPRDESTLIVGRDFLNLWMYGRAAFEPDPGRFYDVATYNRELQALLGFAYPGQNWPNPPSFLLLAAPFGWLSFYPALLWWMVSSITLFAATARREVVDWRVLVPVMISPAAMFCLISGQSSFFSSAALIAIFAWLDRRPILAGMLIGLLTTKPQLGLLFPFMLMASGRWRVFTAAAVTALALVLLTAALFGPQVWIDFVEKSLRTQQQVLADPNAITTPFHATVFMNLRGVGLSHNACLAIQLMFAGAAIGAVIWAFRFRKDADRLQLRGLFLACAASTSPYLGIYDLLPLTFAAVALLASGQLDQVGRRLVQAVFWLPVLQLALGEVRIPGPALIAPLFAGYLLRRLTRPPTCPTTPA
jgi:Glycosyltransferase family 87